IAGLLEDHRPRAVDDLVGDLLPAVRRQAVHEDGARRAVHDRQVDLVGRECFAPSVALGLLPHGRPDVCVDHRCLLEIFDVVREFEVVVALLWIVVGRRHDRQGKAGDRRRLDEGVGDVVAVPDIYDVLLRELSRHRLDGHEVGQDLAGVRAVGEAVDDRLLGRPRQLLEVLVRAQPGHRPVDVAVEDPRGVGDGLPDPELDVVLAERRGRAAEPCDADLEGDPGAVRRLLEEHGEMAALKGPLAPPAGLDRMGQVEGGSELGPVEVGQVEEVASLERIQWSDHDRSLPQSRGSMSSPATTGEIWRSRTESNSGRRVRSRASSRRRTMRSRQAFGCRPKAAGLKVSAASFLSWIVRLSVMRTSGQECGSDNVTVSIAVHTARISWRPWMTSRRSRKKHRRAGGQVTNLRIAQAATAVAPAAPAVSANPAVAPCGTLNAATARAVNKTAHDAAATPTVTIERCDRT